MNGTNKARVRVFGKLQALQRERGMPCETEVEIPAEGIAAREVAKRLDLPLDQIEGIFRNHTIGPLSETVLPGDEIAFVPYGTPGPHRYYLGLYEAGCDDD